MVKQIPMRDSKFLAADCHMADTSGTTQYPVILIQTPYNRLLYRFGMPMGIGTNLAASPYAFVIVDWRGFYGSVSAAVAQPNRGQDGYDVIEWITNQPWSNGKVGTWGPSALGKIQFMTAREQHSAHVCAAPLVAAPQYKYQEYYPGGVYRKEYVDQLDALGYGMSSTLLANPHYNALWAYMENTTNYPSEIEIPVFMVAGWYDHNIQLMLDFFQGLHLQSPISVRDKHKILIGPWAHGGFGTAQVGTGQQGELFFPEAAGWSDSLALRFFDFYLRDISNSWENEPVVRYFMSGPMTWQTASNIPELQLPSDTLYFQHNGDLQAEFPTQPNLVRIYDYNPADPSPTIGGMTLRQDLLQGPYDQSPVVESRSDILVFSSEVLSQAVTVKGKIKIHLFISSNRKDTDFSIRLTDVYPDQRSILLREGIIRARFRNGYTVNDTVFMQSGQMYQVVVELDHLAHTFMPGHKIRINVSSSNYPRYDNNLNNGGTMYVPGDTLVATNTLYCNSTNASFVTIPMIGFPTGLPSTEQSQFKIYPNPTSDFACVEHIEDILHVQIFDISGKMILNETRRCVDVSGLTNGIYLIKVTTHSKSYTSKFVKTSVK